MSMHCSLEEHVDDAGVCESGTKKLMHALNAEEKELLLFRAKFKVTHLCDGHRQKYLKKYVGNQRRCCDPLQSHTEQLRSKELREISLDMARFQSNLNLVPGKKLCTQCRKQVMAILKKEEGKQESESIRDRDISEAEGELSINVETLNETLAVCVDESPIDLKKLGQKRYPEMKVKKIECSICKKLKLGDVPVNRNESSKEELEYREMLDQLKITFHGTDDRSRKLTVLTLLPQSWSIRRIENEFGTTNHMARSAKQLVADQGVLRNPNPRPGKSLSCDTVELVKKFYENDEISRVMPGKKDCVTVKVGDKKEVLQKRLLLCNMAEAHKKFKDDHPEVKVGFTKFTELRPKNVVLAVASGTHSVCVCTIHQNVKHMIDGCKILNNPEFKTLFDVGSDARITYRHLLAKLSCNPALPECLLGECMLCQNTELHGVCDYCDSMDTSDDCEHCRKVLKLRNNIVRILEQLNIDEMMFKAWVSVNRTTLETLTKKVDDYVESLIESLVALRTHDFIAKQQAAFLMERKNDLKAGEIVVISDFAENFSFVIQDAAQGYHWTNEQATLHPFVVYYFGTKIQSGRGSSVQHDDDISEKLRCVSFVIISECLKHDTVAVHYFLKLLLQFLTTTLTVNKAYYFSDGAASQYKNIKNS